MKPEPSSDDLWTQRRLSTFQTFARGQEQAKLEKNAAWKNGFENGGGGHGYSRSLVESPSSNGVVRGHAHSHSFSFTSMDSNGSAESPPDAGDEDEETLDFDVEVILERGDRRFGFSVIGGRDEGFPPCIDEISHGSPADKADLEVGDEILEVNGRSLEDATHTEVISHIHQCIRSRTICLRVKRRGGNKLALDLASQSNVQDAFVIAVEQQARERLEKLSALKRIKPVDMTKLSHQLSETPSVSGGETSELNGLIEAATGSPIYVTSAQELSSSQQLYPSAEEVKKSRSTSASPSSLIPNSTNASLKSPLTNGHLRDGGVNSPSRHHQVIRNGALHEVKAEVNKATSKESLNSRKKKGSVESVGQEESEPSKSVKSSSRESIVDPEQYANMINMVEWDNGPHREMAVDVPDSFVPRNKTPPRYPPNKATTLNGKKGNGSTKSGNNNGTATLPPNGAAGKPVPPPRIGEKDGWNVNNNNAPHPTPRTTTGQKTEAQVSPARDQAERIRKYQEELKKRREQEERQAKEDEFLRTSMRGSKKLQALEARRNESPDPSGFVNDAYDEDEGKGELPISIPTQVDVAELTASLERVQQVLKKNGIPLDDSVSKIEALMGSPEFLHAFSVHNKVQDTWCFNSPPTPISAHLHQLVLECLGSLYNCSDPESAELLELLSRVDFEGLFYAHDKIAERERVIVGSENPLNLGESVDDVVEPNKVTGSRAVFVPEPQPDDHIRVVRIEKTQDPLGATVRNEAEAVVIGRIVKGGAAERSGLLHEGDEILEVNGMEMRGKSVNEVCDILSRMTGTLTFLIVPTPNPPPPITQRREILIHVRAHFDYDPEDDIYVPCRELGIAFSKGDVLHVISQEDSNWWQAHREGEEDQALAGLIPSKSFQEQREAVKQTILGETETREKSKRGTLLCAKTGKKKKKKIPYSTAFNDDFDADDVPTYEEVGLYYPRTSFKRPVVLIGPPNIGRHELRQRLMQESDRFAAAVPHTSRTRKEGEMDGQDYHFISRAQFESDILSRKFVEHGEFEKAYYGTGLDAIRSVVNVGKICVLNLHPQSLKILRSSDLKPYIVFIAPPPLERLKQMRIAREEAYKEEELIDIIEKAREMEEKYGHFFDLVIINNDIERTYHELVQRINYIEREPQWVPAAWLKQ